MSECFQCLEQDVIEDGVHEVSPDLWLCDSCYITHELLPTMKSKEEDYIQQIQSLSTRLSERAATVERQMRVIHHLKQSQIPGYCKSCIHCDVRYLSRTICLLGHHCEFCSNYKDRVAREEPKPPPRTRYMARGRVVINQSQKDPIEVT